MFLTKTKIAFSALSLILLRTTYTNCPTVRSSGMRYLNHTNPKKSQINLKYTTDFFLSILGTSNFSQLSLQSPATYTSSVKEESYIEEEYTHQSKVSKKVFTGTLSGYLSLVREASISLLSDITKSQKD